MNISPIVNSVKCTVLACFAQFWHVLEVEGSTAVVDYLDPATCIELALARLELRGVPAHGQQAVRPASWASYNTLLYYNLIVL